MKGNIAPVDGTEMILLQLGGLSVGNRKKNLQNSISREEHEIRDAGQKLSESWFLESPKLRFKKKNNVFMEAFAQEEQDAHQEERVGSTPAI